MMVAESHIPRNKCGGLKNIERKRKIKRKRKKEEEKDIDKAKIKEIHYEKKFYENEKVI